MSTGTVRAIATASLLGCVLLVLHALILGLHFEDTPRALEDAARGKAVGYPAFLGGLLATVALLGARRRWAPGVAFVALVLGAAALVVDLLW
ncbi:hypothetical protein [Nocardioides sp. SYSU DS0663]|uniref:hypothetical protein n=1 Tax=Nocardioides sp. SYSU DS0663 TaxID=3416445 RepID=UPI003F4B637A